MKVKEGLPTRLVFVRHLDTGASIARDRIKESDHEGRELSHIFEKKSAWSDEEYKQARVDAEILFDRYGYSPADGEVSIVEGQEAKGRAIGQELLRRYHIGRWEISPFRRTRQTSELVREGMGEIDLPREIANSRLRERSFGDADRYPSFRVYLALHPQELAKYLKDRKAYHYPHGDNRQSFARRVWHNTLHVQWRRAYEGETTVIVTHGGVIKEHIKQLTGVDTSTMKIPTGSITILEAEPKKIFRPRRYHVVGQPGESVVESRYGQASNNSVSH